MKKLLLILFFPLFLSAQPGYHLPWDKNFFSQKAAEKKAFSPSILAKGANVFILFHQTYLSPACGPRSNFRPTSSRYMQLSIQRYGFLKGFIMGCDRLMRENDESWVYPLITIGNTQYKYDPALIHKSKIIR
ncbi:MAG: membrane protein insertion efficiency factor YidD [Parachlamydiales bacterium]|nr:membrane protein insertion efficiency factor YidD [Parachlamydiales bacterium]